MMTGLGDEAMRGMVRQVIGFLRQHLLLIFVLLILVGLAVLAITSVLWNFPAWLWATFGVLQQNLLLVGLLGFGLAIIVLLWGLPKWQAARSDLTSQERFTIENEARKTLAQIVAGAAVLAGLYFTWANLQITQDTATKNQAITHEGQITDRFTKAIAQLGEQEPEKLAVRLGGIYALERIARDSEKDHWPIMEVLTAYVREHAPWPPKRSKDVQPLKGDPSPQEEPSATPNDPHPQLAADIQAVLTVLGRRTHTYRNGEEQRLNLANTDLRGANLWKAQLQGVDLGLAQLQGAYLRGAQLKGAKNLTVEQLSTVGTLYQADIDLPLLEQIQQRYSQLLEKRW
jgi:hypothetical protein